MFSLIKKSGSLTTEVMIILFDDMILIVKTKKVGFALVKPPIPLEECLFIDKPESASDRNTFQIIHFPFEAYSFQSYTSFDKHSWIQEAESTRASFTAFHYEMELGYMRMNFERYKSLSQIKLSQSSIHQDNRASSDGSNHKRQPKMHSGSESDFNRQRDSFSPSNAGRFSYMQIFKTRKSCDELNASCDPMETFKNVRISAGGANQYSRGESLIFMSDNERRQRNSSRLSRLTSSMSTILGHGKASPQNSFNMAHEHSIASDDKANSLTNFSEPDEIDIDAIVAAGDRDSKSGEASGSAELRHQNLRKPFGLIRKETIRK